MSVDLEALTGLSGDDPMHATVADLLGDPATSHWLRVALAGALKRDPVQVLNEIDVLRAIVEARIKAIEERHGDPGRGS